MFDRFLIQKLDPIRRAGARALLALRCSPNGVSLVAFMIGLLGATSIAFGGFTMGLLCILVNRVLDGLDGPLAQEMLRRNKHHNTKLGGYLDSVFDFIFYSSIPAAFIIANPKDNALAGAVLMLAFMTTCVSFLVFAAVNPPRTKYSYNHDKSFRYITGLTEGFETIIFFVILCLIPSSFSLFAWIFAGMCFVTGFMRVKRTRYLLQNEHSDE